jgi:hypothetical protein
MRGKSKHKSKRYQGGGEASGMWDPSGPSSSFGAGFAQGMSGAARVGAAGAAIRSALNKSGGGGAGSVTNADVDSDAELAARGLRRGGPTRPRGPKIGKEDGLIAAQKGEYVIRKSSAKKLGTKTLDHINRKGTLPRQQGRGR